MKEFDAWVSEHEQVQPPTGRSTELSHIFSAPYGVANKSVGSGWSDKTPTDILADVNALLAKLYYAPTPQPDVIIMTVKGWWFLAGYCRVAALQKARRKKGLRRPKRFERQVPRRGRP
jgi:hypothetical protein